jgi:hypothetical protein
VLASKVEQVFYVEDERNPDWACAATTNLEMCMMLVRVKGLMMMKPTTTRVILSYWIVIIKRKLIKQYKKKDK